jgi:ubiquinone/menaquinone biosynthesis C-methylase UbiE
MSDIEDSRNRSGREELRNDGAITVSDVREYWETNTPQYWYTAAKPGSKEYFDDIQRVRYSLAYPYLSDFAEFDKHRDEKVLEIGCGQGTDLMQFAQGGAIVTGVDLTENAIRKAEEMFAVYEQKVRLLTCNAESLEPFEDNSFDVVYSFGVLHHTPDTEAAIAEVYRVLRPGGKAIIMLYGKGLTWMLAFLYWHLFKGEFLHANFKQSLSKHAEHEEGCPLANYYSKKECRQLFTSFSNVETTQLHCYNYEPDSKSVSFLYRIKHAIARLLNATRITQSIFGHNIMIKATKD